MDPRAAFARMFPANAGDFQFPRPDAAGALRSLLLQETYPRPDAGDVIEYGMPRRVGGHHFGSPAMQSFFADQGIGAAAGAGEVSLAQAMTSMANANPTLAPTVATTTIQKSLVDQYGNRIDDKSVSPPPLGGGTQPPPQGETQQGREGPATGSTGTSTTTMLLFGGAAFLAVMLLLRKKK